MTAGLLSPRAVELLSPYKWYGTVKIAKSTAKMNGFCNTYDMLLPQRYPEGLQRESNKANSSWEARQVMEDPVTIVM